MTWDLEERVTYFTDLFYELENTNSRIEKMDYIEQIPEELKEDFIYIIKCLTGEIKFGYTYPYLPNVYLVKEDEFVTITEVLNHLLKPLKEHNLTEAYIDTVIYPTRKYQSFFRPIVNREWKLGIGKSLLEKPKYSPMLAKKFEGQLKPDKEGYFVTEKLDGNRCLAYYDSLENKWKFMSRNGKEMHVDFNMCNLPKDVIFDGEVLSREQVELSKTIYSSVVEGIQPVTMTNTSFNKTSGDINKHSLDKDLVYNIFDYIDIDDEGNCKSTPYLYRRTFLNNINLSENDNVRILPVLKHSFNDNDFLDLLEQVTNLGGEGIMINYASRPYEQKRTDSLLKFKKMETMDMKVIDFEYGTGKYEFLIGSLICQLWTSDGKCIECKVGTGLSDEQRTMWAEDLSEILGKIVEVGYFSLSQNKEDIGTKRYSLRFPRLIRIRSDKNSTSEY